MRVTSYQAFFATHVETLGAICTWNASRSLSSEQELYTSRDCKSISTELTEPLSELSLKNYLELLMQLLLHFHLNEQRLL